ncbi:hypothetical protein [Sinorhizobium arboris]|uniref:hypothetical protein n=1 Tax=Sinorhizobium arboris TaxID=76745 RepID=UPI00124321E3|nr:hypothetical protein [Sinorhizobium arboris]
MKSIFAGNFDQESAIETVSMPQWPWLVARLRRISIVARLTTNSGFAFSLSSGAFRCPIASIEEVVEPLAQSDAVSPFGRRMPNLRWVPF